jgi:hypothetical protein
MSTKYQVGDKVWIEFDVINVDDCSDQPVKVKQSMTGFWWPPASTIKHHIPKQREFKPGDIVRAGLDKADYELIAIRGQVAFLWFQEQLYGRTAPLDTIRHADEAAP